MYIQLFYVYMCVTTPRPLFVVLLPHLKEYYIQTSTPHVYTYYICTTTPGDSRFSINALCFSVVRFCGLISGILYNITRTIKMGCWAFFYLIASLSQRKFQIWVPPFRFVFRPRHFIYTVKKGNRFLIYLFQIALSLYIIGGEYHAPIHMDVFTLRSFFFSFFFWFFLYTPCRLIDREKRNNISPSHSKFEQKIHRRKPPLKKKQKPL